jgi:hypothetical protein
MGPGKRMIESVVVLSLLVFWLLFKSDRLEGRIAKLEKTLPKPEPSTIPADRITIE